MEFNQSEQQKEKMKKSEDALRNLCDNIKQTNIHVVRSPEGEKKEKAAQK